MTGDELESECQQLGQISRRCTVDSPLVNDRQFELDSLACS